MLPIAMVTGASSYLLYHIMPEPVHLIGPFLNGLVSTLQPFGDGFFFIGGEDLDIVQPVGYVTDVNSIYIGVALWKKAYHTLADIDGSNTFHIGKFVKKR